jgi:hypothetical protein
MILAKVTFRQTFPPFCPRPGFQKRFGPVRHSAVGQWFSSASGFARLSPNGLQIRSTIRSTKCTVFDDFGGFRRPPRACKSLKILARVDCHGRGLPESYSLTLKVHGSIRDAVRHESRKRCDARVSTRHYQIGLAWRFTPGLGLWAENPTVETHSQLTPNSLSRAHFCALPSSHKCRKVCCLRELSVAHNRRFTHRGPQLFSERRHS